MVSKARSVLKLLCELHRIRDVKKMIIRDVETISPFIARRKAKDRHFLAIFFSFSLATLAAACSHILEARYTVPVYLPLRLDANFLLCERAHV